MSVTEVDSVGTAAGSTPAATTAGSVRRWVRRYAILVITVVNLGAFFSLWQLVAALNLVNPLFMPAPSAIFRAMYQGFADGTITPHLAHSLLNFVVGMAIASAIGIPIGLLMGASRLVDTVLSPYVWSFAALPGSRWCRCSS